MGLADALDAIPIVQNTAERAVRFAAPQVGQRVQNLTSKAIERWAGAWVTDFGGLPATVLNVQQSPYNAVGDYVADDTAAIQAALDAAGVIGGAVYLPPASVAYRITTTLLVPSNVTVYGDGVASFIRASATFSVNAVMIQAVGKSNITLRHFRAEGNVASLPVDIIQLKTCTDSRILFVDVRYASHEGISLNQSTYDCLVLGCLIRDISSATGWGIGMFWDIRRCRILVNTIRDCGAYGILVDDGTTGQSDNLPCIGNIIAGNVIETTTTGMWGIGIEGSYENEVEGNRINIISTFGIDLSIGNSTVVFAPQRNIVKGNFVASVKGIRLAGSYNRVVDNIITASDTGILCDQGIVLDSVGNVLDNNTILGLTAGNKTGVLCSHASFKDTDITNTKIPSSGQYGLWIQAGSGYFIAFSRIKNTQKQAILVTGVIDGLDLLLNRVANAGLAAAATYGAITLDATANLISNATIFDNRCRDATGFAWACVVYIGGAGTFVNTQQGRNRSINPAVPDFLMLNPDLIQNESFQTGLTGGAVTPSSAQDNETVVVTATSNVTVNPPGQKMKNSRITFIILQGGAGGFTVTFAAGFLKSWSDAGNTVGKRSSISFIFDGANWVQNGAQSPYV